MTNAKLAYLGFEIIPAARLRDEPQRWLVARNGFQVGGEVDSSGAGDATFASREEAVSFAKAYAQAKA